MLKKILIFVVVVACITGAAYAQKDLVIKEKIPVYAKLDLPMPQDPVTGEEMALSGTDMALKKKADEYLRREQYGSAIGEVKKISSKWAERTFLSFIYEQQQKYKQAVLELDWMIGNCRNELLKEQLNNRRRILSGMMMNREKPDMFPAKPEKKAVLWGG